MDKQLYTQNEVAEILRVNPRTVYRYLLAGRLKGIKLGKAWRVSEEDLEAFLKSEKERTANDLKAKGKQEV